MRSRAARSLLATMAFGLLAGCMGADLVDTQLDLSEGQGDFLVLLELVDGVLVQGDASWVSNSAAPDRLLDATVPGWEVVVLKDDVRVDSADVLGSPERAFVVWRSSDVDARVSAGDVFTFYVLDGGDTIAEFRVEVTS